MILAELRKIGATCECALDAERRFLVRLKICTISILIEIRALLVNSTKSTGFLACLHDKIPYRRMVAIVDEIGACGPRAVSKSDASVNGIETRAARAIPPLAIARAAAIWDANKASRRTRGSNLVANGFVVAETGEIVARRMLQEAAGVVHVKTCVLRCDILAFDASLQE